MSIIRRLRKNVKAEIAATLVNARGSSVAQAQLMLQLQELADPRTPQQFALSVHSQFEEDGILLWLFANVGTTTREAVELCAGDCIESNSANLILNHGWTGLMCDADAANVAAGKRFYQRCRPTRIWPPRVVQQWLTAENVNAFLREHEVRPDPDLLSIDVDGMDYWLWRAIDVVSPRVVVVEINHLWGAEKAVTVPYSPDFRATFSPHGSDYAGASLPAMIKLGKQKGYRLVAVNRLATNAFFVRNDVSPAIPPEISAENCFSHPRARFGREVRFRRIADQEWIEV